MRKRTAICLIASMLLLMTACSQKSTGPINEKGSSDVIEETTQEETEEEKKAREEAEKAEKEAEEAARKEAEEAAKREAEEAARLAEVQAAFDDGMGYWFAINDHPYDMEKAFECFSKAAEGGNADAWYWMGVLTEYGVDADRWTKVLEYYEKAWENGSAWGLYGQGGLYKSGLGYERDYQKAFELFSQAVDEGCPMGYIGLAGMYYYGNGVEKDGEKALEYYGLAMESDDWVIRNCARIKAAAAYYYGESGIEIDIDKAKELDQAAIDEDYGDGYGDMGIDYDPAMTSDESTDEEEAFYWYQLAEKYGIVYNLSICYFYGLGTEQNSEQAVELFRSQENGGRDACNCLAGLSFVYFTGQGAEQNNELAIEYARKAIAAGLTLEKDVTDTGYGMGLARRILSELGVE